MSQVNRKLAAKIRKIARAAGVNSLFSSPEANPKVAKNAKVVDVLTAPLHLAPANISGFEVCGGRSIGCTMACLHTSGNPMYMEGKERARIARTKLFFNKEILLVHEGIEYKGRDVFMLLLVLETELHIKRAAKRNMEAAVRLNATSDIPWESIKVYALNAPNIMAVFPEIQFYDYTKLLRRNIPANYDLTFSLAEDNDDKAGKAIDLGMNVAVVFDGELPETFEIAGRVLPVINADEHDYRPADARGSIAGLKAKGDAKKDTSGFVRKGIAKGSRKVIPLAEALKMAA